MDNRAKSDADHARLIVAGELVAAVTHDLRQPLTALEMNVAAALRLIDHEVSLVPADKRAPLADAAEALKDALLEGHRMREALQALQDLAVRREPALRPTSLEECARDAARLLSSDATARHISITVACDAGLPRVMADEALVRQGLVNVLLDALASGAARGTGPGRIAIEVRGTGLSWVEVRVAYPEGDMDLEPPEPASLALARSVAEVHGASLATERGADRARTVVMRWPTGRQEIGLTAVEDRVERASG